MLRIPLEVGDIGGCLAAAQRLVDTAKADAEALAETQDAKETGDLRAAYGAAEGSKAPRGMAGAVKELEKRQKSRATRTRRETLGVALLDLLSFYRDVLALQLGSTGALSNEDQRQALNRVAQAGPPEGTLRRIEAVLACRRGAGPQRRPAARRRGDDRRPARGLSRRTRMAARGGAVTGRTAGGRR